MGSIGGGTGPAPAVIIAKLNKGAIRTLTTLQRIAWRACGAAKASLRFYNSCCIASLNCSAT